MKILKGLRPHYEKHHGVKITDEALYQAARLSDRYVTDQFLPDKAIDLIDETAARIKLRSSFLPDDVRELMAEMETLDEQEQEAVAAQDYETAARLRDQKEELAKEIDEMSGSARQKTGLQAGEKDIAQVVTMRTLLTQRHCLKISLRNFAAVAMKSLPTT